MDKSIVRYLRLSLDDENVVESNSISNQREIIDNHIATIPDLANEPVLEFVDDGYSGTNFERPGIKGLLEAVRRGRISCIIVKDLSRFGRQYLEVSKYIEQIFPCLGIRFISVNDHYDSDSHIGTTTEIDIPVRNMINAIYAKDVSKKVKTAKQTAMRQGKYINAFAPYGYKKDEANKHRIVIDEPAAEVVRRIFALTCDGQTPTQIANTLNADGILTPCEYKRKNGSKMKILGMTKAVWSNYSIHNILRNEQYTGIYIGGRVEMGELGSGKLIHKPKEEWIRIPNAHPAIITQEIWDMAIAQKPQIGGTQGKPKTDRILYNRVRCGHCNHVLRYRDDGRYQYYFCLTPRYSEEYGCNRKVYQAQSIIDAVKATVKAQIAAMIDMGELCKDRESITNKDFLSTQIAILQLDKEIEQLKSFKRLLYERYSSGTLNKAAYIKERESVDNDICSKTAKRDKLTDINGNWKDKVMYSENFFNSFLKYHSETDLSAEVVNDLVEAVHVYGKDRIEITYSFKDELEKAITVFENKEGLLYA